MQNQKLDVSIFNEDIQVLNDDVYLPAEIGVLVQSIVDIAINEQKIYYKEIIEYLLDALEEEHLGSRAFYLKELGVDFHYDEFE